MATQENEEWAPIPGTDRRYFASTLGRIASQIDRGEGVPEFKILSPYTRPDGYEVVNINGDISLVHRLVAKAHTDDYSENLTVHHQNNQRDDNRLENLTCVTGVENTKLAHRDGRMPGNNYPHERCVRAVVFALTSELPYSVVSDLFDIKQSAIYRMVIGKFREEVLQEAKGFIEEQGLDGGREKRTRKKLDDGDAVEAVEEYLTTDQSQKDIAEKYGVSESQIFRLVNGKQRPEVLEQAQMKTN